VEAQEDHETAPPDLFSQSETRTISQEGSWEDERKKRAK